MISSLGFNFHRDRLRSRRSPRARSALGSAHGVEPLESRRCPAIVALGPVTVPEGDAVNLVQVTISRDLSDNGLAWVRFRTEDDTSVPMASRALAGSDYMATSGTLIFSPNQRTAALSVRVLGDRVIESSEQFKVVLFNPSGTSFPGGVSTLTVPFTISNDDVLQPQVSLSASASSVVEGKAITYSMTLSAPSKAPVVVQYATQAGTALAGQDFFPATGSVTFAPGETVKTVSVQTVADTVAEGTESFRFTMDKITGATSSGSSSIQSNIVNQVAVSVTTAGKAVKEGEFVPFTVSLSQPASVPVVVDLKTFAGVATEDDFTSISPDGVSSIRIVDGGRNYAAPPIVSLEGGGGSGAEAVAEIAGGRVTRVVMKKMGSGYTSAPQVVFADPFNGLFGAQGATAVAELQGRVTFAPGERTKTVGVYARPDTSLEGEEDFSLQIVAATGAVVIPTAASATGVIAAESGMPPGVKPGDPAVSGGRRGSWTILVYMVGSGPVADSYYNKINTREELDLDQMELSVARPDWDPDVRIVVAWDQPSDRNVARTGAAVYDFNNGRPQVSPRLNATDFAHSYALDKAVEPSPKFLFNVLTDRDSGSQQTLSSFLDWGRRIAPADRYALIVRGYGDPKLGMVVDYDNPDVPSGLTAAEVGLAVKGFSDSGRKVEVVAFDSNVSARAEVAYEVALAGTRTKPIAVVFSQEMVDRKGLDYGGTGIVWPDPDPDMPFSHPGPADCFQIFLGAGAGKAASREAVAQCLVKKGYELKYKGHEKQWDTYSAFVSHVENDDGLNSAIGGLAASIINTASANEWPLVVAARNKAIQYGIAASGSSSPRLPFYDAGSFVKNLIAEGGLNQTIKDAAQRVLNVLEMHLLDRVADQRKSSGLSLYMPTNLRDPYMDLETFRRLHGGFTNSTQWDKFVRWLVEGTA